MQRSLSSDFWRALAEQFPAVLVLFFTALASGGLGALLTIRLLMPRSPSLGAMLRIIFSRVAGG